MYELNVNIKGPGKGFRGESEGIYILMTGISLALAYLMISQCWVGGGGELVQQDV
jgi:hypothetical protein